MLQTNLLIQIKKKQFNTEIIFFHIAKNYALRELTQLYSFTALKVVEETKSRNKIVQHNYQIKK